VEFVEPNVCGLRFLYRVTLRREWAIEHIPYPRQERKLPVALSLAEVARFFEAVANIKHRAILMTAYAAGLRTSEVVKAAGQRHRQPADDDPYQSGEGAQGPLRHAFAEAAGVAARLIGRWSSRGMAVSGQEADPLDPPYWGAASRSESRPRGRLTKASQYPGCCGIALPRICWSQAPTYASSRCCWGITTCRLRRGTPTSQPVRFVPHPAPSIYCRSRSGHNRQSCPDPRSRWRTSSAATARSTGNCPRHCRRSSDVSCARSSSAGLPHSAATGTSVTAAATSGTPTTPAVTGTVPSASLSLRPSGSRLARRNSCRSSTSHVVFTVPEAVAPVALHRTSASSNNILFKAASETLLTIAADPSTSAARIGFLAVLHTWGQNLLHHPHLHCVGSRRRRFTPHGRRWVPCRPGFSCPYVSLSQMFRGKFLDYLKQAFDQGNLQLHGKLAPLTDSRSSTTCSRAPARPTGSSTPSRLSAAPPRSWITSVATRTGSPSSNHRLVRLEERQGHFSAGRTTPMATASA